MMFSEAFFARNQGILSVVEQEKLCSSHLWVVDYGRVGDTVALSLVRTGLETFTLVDFDTYTPCKTSHRQLVTWFSKQ
jgi:tRNA A37 threonylcarbamoyladenosine dehydratase